MIEERARADSYKLQLEKAEAEKKAIAELADEKVKAAVATALRRKTHAGDESMYAVASRRGPSPYYELPMLAA